MAEQAAHNRWVPGSSPGGPTKILTQRDLPGGKSFLLPEPGGYSFVGGSKWVSPSGIQGNWAVIRSSRMGSERPVKAS